MSLLRHSLTNPKQRKCFCVWTRIGFGRHLETCRPRFWKYFDIMGPPKKAGFDSVTALGKRS